MIITNSHPRLSWLPKAQAVPEHIARQMAELRSSADAQDFVSAAGLKVRVERRGQTETAFSVYLDPMESNYPSFRSQVALTRVDAPEVPVGSALINCLLPEIEDLKDAEGVFRRFQESVLAFSKRLEASPFAVIAGHKTQDPPHDLFSCGFRLFFSPRPDVLFERISDLLSASLRLRELPTPEEKRAQAELLTNLKFCRIGGQQIGHSLLEDVKPQSFDSTLVDLR
ncbi:MAG: hypothetical protein WC645_06845 [Candidatus Margulisiibacteriota bacterium]